MMMDDGAAAAAALCVEDARCAIARRLHERGSTVGATHRRESARPSERPSPAGGRESEHPAWRGVSSADGRERETEREFGGGGDEWLERERERVTREDGWRHKRRPAAQRHSAEMMCVCIVCARAPL